MACPSWPWSPITTLHSARRHCQAGPGVVRDPQGIVGSMPWIAVVTSIILQLLAAAW